MRLRGVQDESTGRTARLESPPFHQWRLRLTVLKENGGTGRQTICEGAEPLKGKGLQEKPCELSVHESFLPLLFKVQSHILDASMGSALALTSLGGKTKKTNK